MDCIRSGNHTRQNIVVDFIPSLCRGVSLSLSIRLWVGLCGSYPKGFCVLWPPRGQNQWQIFLETAGQKKEERLYFLAIAYFIPWFILPGSVPPRTTAGLQQREGNEVLGYILYGSVTFRFVQRSPTVRTRNFDCKFLMLTFLLPKLVTTGFCSL